MDPVKTFSWINEKISQGESTVSKDGLFAQKDIQAGEILVVQGGQCLHIDEIDNAGQDKFSYFGFQVEEKIYIMPIFDGDIPTLDGIFKVNHSCEPNAGFRGQVTLVAMRDIKSGEEIFFDYAMTDIQYEGDKEWDTLECHCGTPACRKMITGTDWKIAHLQEKYSGFFSTHVAKAIAEHTNNS